MNINRFLFSAGLLCTAVIMSSSGCGDDSGNAAPLTTQYILNGQTLTTTDPVIRTDSTFESTCQNNSKIYIIVSKDLYSSTGPLQVVNYNQTTPLLPNQIKIDIADGVGNDYLSTGDTTDPTGTTPVRGNWTTDLHTYTLGFQNVPLRQYGSSGPGTTVIRSSGFLSKNM